MSAAAPLSRRILLAEVSPTGTVRTLTASESERQAVASLLDLPSIERLEARFEVAPFGRDGINVAGRVEAELHQTCVLTLDAFPTRVAAEVEVRFAPPDAVASAEQRGFHSPTDEAEGSTDLDLPDTLVDGGADLGALAVEHLALALDPYPRKPGAAFESAPDETAAEDNPFAVLKRLRDPSSDEPH